MLRPNCITGRAAACTLALAFLGITIGKVEAAGLHAHIDGGFGFSDVRPLASPTTFGAMSSGGVSAPLRGRWHFGAELTATAGDDVGGHIPEGPFAGKRSLTTLLVGLESASARDARGLFAGAGVGIGHFTLSGATRGSREFLYPGWAYPSRNGLGPALGVAVGYRTHGGPGPMGFQLAWRYHAIASSGRVATSAAALTVGLTY